MGKHNRLKASSKDKKRHYHPDHPAAAAPAAPEMEDAYASQPADSALQKTAAGSGKALGVRPTSPGDSSSSSAEEVQNLRTLNGILAKQMVEARQERDQDQLLLSDLERGAIRVALSWQLSQEAGRVARLAEERGRVEGLEEAGREATREMEGRLAAEEARWMEAVDEIEREKAAACEEAARLKGDVKELGQEKAEVEKNLRTAAMEMDAVRCSLQDARKALERGQEENEIFKKDLQSLLLERDETRKQLGVQMEEVKALEIMISDLERRHEEARQALERALSECRALAEDSKAKGAALVLLTKEKASLEMSLAESLQMADDLRRQMGDTVLAKDEEVNRVVRERDEAREGLRLQMQEMECLVVGARKVTREVLARALSQCRPSEETAADWKRDLELFMGKAASGTEGVLADALRLLSKLSEEMARAVLAKGEVLEQTRAEMEKVISRKEEELANLTKVHSCLGSQLAGLREEHESLKVEEEGLRSQVAKLSASNGEAQKLLEDLRVELKKQIEEKEETTRSYQSLVEGHLQQIEDLTGKMEAAAEERDEVERVKSNQEDEICGLREEVAQLNSEIAVLQDLSSNHARKNELLRAEKDGALERLGEQTQKAEALMPKLEQMEKTKRAIEQELGDLQAANAQLLEEKQQLEGQVGSLGEEKASADTGLAAAERRLEGAEEKAKALRELAKEALCMMKGAAAEAARGIGGGEKGKGAREGGGGEGKPGVEVVVEGIRPFAAAVEAIREALRGREAEVERMREELQQQERANTRRMWISSAVAGFLPVALASMAFVAKGR